MRLVPIVILLLFFEIYHCVNHENAVDEIVFVDEFNGNEILAHFTDDTTLVLNVSKIKGFFVFPTQFYQLKAWHEDKLLPLFFINADRTVLFSLLLYCCNFDTNAELRKIKEVGPSSIEEDILAIREGFYDSFEDCQQFVIFLANIFPTCESIRFESFSTFKSYFNRVRYPIPIMYFQNLYHAEILKGNCLGNLVLKKFESAKLHKDENFTRVGSGFAAECFKVRIFTNSTAESYTNLVFKKPYEPFIFEFGSFDFNEFSIFQQARITDKSKYSSMSCLVIDKNTGSGVGFLTAYVKYGDLKGFIKSELESLDPYFIRQLLELSQSLHSLHLKGMIHGDLCIKNIFVDEMKSDSKDFSDRHPGKNYRLLLGDFGRSFCVCTDHYNYNSSIDEQSLKEHNCEWDYCTFGITTEWIRYSSIFSDIFFELALKQRKVLNVTDTFLILVVSIGEGKKLSCIENYLSCLSSNDFSSIDVCGEQTMFEFDADAGFLLVSHHGTVRTYKRGEGIDFGSKFSYSLYQMMADDVIPPIKFQIENVVEKINQFAKEFHGIENLLKRQYIYK